MTGMEGLEVGGVAELGVAERDGWVGCGVVVVRGRRVCVLVGADGEWVWVCAVAFGGGWVFGFGFGFV